MLNLKKGLIRQMEKEYAAQMIEKAINKKPTKEITIEGIGTAKLYGNFDSEKIIKRLLQSDSITG
jgi:hypothetical protein